MLKLESEKSTLTPTLNITLFNNCSISAAFGLHPRGALAKYLSRVHDLKSLRASRNKLVLRKR